MVDWNRGLVCVALFLALGTVAHADRVFLCIDGVEGGSDVAGREGCIDVLNLSDSLELDESRRRPRVSNVFIVTKPLDRSTAALRRALLTREALTRAQFIFEETGGEMTEFFEIDLEEVYVFTHSGVASDGVPSAETIGLRARIVEWTFTITNEERDRRWGRVLPA